MRWHEIRERYPGQWLLVEAIGAYTEGGKRVLDQFAIIGSFQDSTAALRVYQELHRHFPRPRALRLPHKSRALGCY